MKYFFPTVALHADETAESFLSRIAARNGVTAKIFCDDWSISLNSIVNGCTVALKTLAAIAKCDSAQLIFQSFRKLEGSAWTWRKQRVTAAALCRRSVTRICPACLLEDMADQRRLQRVCPYSRGIWHLRSLRTCPKHDQSLIVVDRDPNESVFDFAANVRASLPELTALNAKTIDRPATQFEHYIARRAREGAGGNWLDTLDLHAAMAFVEHIGKTKLRGQWADNISDDERFYLAGDAGFQIAASGPAAIKAFWSELQPTKTGRNLIRGLSSGYRWLSSPPTSHQAYDPLRELMREHIITTRPVGPKDKIFGLLVDERKVHSIRSAAVEYDMHPKRLKKLVHQAKIVRSASHSTGDGSGSRDNDFCFQVEDAGDLLVKAQSAMSLNDVVAYLATTRVQGRLLFEEGFLQPFVRLDGGGSRKITEHNFAKADVDRFLRRLTAQAILVQRAPEGAFDISSTAKRACCSTGEILRLILGMQLKWVGHLASRPGLSGLLVDLEEIKSLVQGPPRQGLTPREVEAALRTTTKVIRALIANGILQAATITNPINRCPTTVISNTEIARFKAMYVSLFNLSAERGQHLCVVKRELSVRGIVPALNQKTFGATFYLRGDLV